MLEIKVPKGELFNEETSEFLYCDGVTLQLEHSLISLSKWESKWKKHYLNNPDKTNEESLDYVRCMTINKNVDPNVYKMLSPSNFKAINEYIEDSMTATWFSETQKKPVNKSVITSELIYYWMISYNIPFECQKWHLNRLLTLIRVCSVKNEPPKKMGKNDLMRRNSDLNKARRKKLKTKG